MFQVPRATVRDALSVALTVGAYGVAFGAAGVAAGFSVLQTCLFSLVTFTGASQFAAVGVVPQAAHHSPRSARPPCWARAMPSTVSRWRRCCGCVACGGSSRRT